jgi:hypothetical protein
LKTNVAEADREKEAVRGKEAEIQVAVMEEVDLEKVAEEDGLQRFWIMNENEKIKQPNSTHRYQTCDTPPT